VCACTWNGPGASYQRGGQGMCGYDYLYLVLCMEGVYMCLYIYLCVHVHGMELEEAIKEAAKVYI
jgi:hypothetical protein